MNEASTMTLEYLADRHLDGQSTSAERDRLSALLRDDPAARDRFVSLCIQARVLRESLAAAAEVENSRRVQGSGFEQGVQGSGFRIQIQAMFAIAALVALAVTAWFLSRPEPRTLNPEPSTAAVAMLSDLSDDAVFAESAAVMNLGAELAPGVIHLKSGAAQVMFKSGAVVDLKGPCEFHMVDDRLGRLVSGSLNAYVVPRASGFTIAAPGEVRIVDLGTRFSVRIDEPVTTTVYVLEGLVRLQSPGRTVNLLAGQAARYDSAGQPVQLAYSVIPLDPRHTYLHTVVETPDAPAPVDLASLGIMPGQAIRLMQLGDYQGQHDQRGGADRIQTLCAVFGASEGLLPHAAVKRVREALSAVGVESAPTPPAAATNAAGEHEPTDIDEDFRVPVDGVRVIVPAGARYLWLSARDSYFSDNADPDGDYAVGIEVESDSLSSPPRPRGADAPARASDRRPSIEIGP